MIASEIFFESFFWEKFVLAAHFFIMTYGSIKLKSNGHPILKFSTARWV